MGSHTLAIHTSLVLSTMAINILIRESRKIVLMSLFKRRNGDADIENGLVDAVGEGEARANRERSIDIYTLYHV